MKNKLFEINPFHDILFLNYMLLNGVLKHENTIYQYENEY